MKSNRQLFRILIIALIVLLVLNIAFMALKIISNFFFWIVIIAAAVFAYKVLPKMKK